MSAVVRNNKFLYSALNAFSPEDVMNYFEELGVPLKTERGNRVFPVSDKAADIADAMLRKAENSGAEILLNQYVKSVRLNETGNGFCVKTKNDIYYSDRVLMACGGVSYPGTGSNGEGFRFAEKLGHSVTALKPSLVPLVEEGNLCKTLQGLSLKNCGIKITNNTLKKAVYTDFGELMFTHYGLSGPVILSASAHIQNISPGKYSVYIDLKPALDENKLDLRLQREFFENKNSFFVKALAALLPQKLIMPIAEMSGISPQIRCNEISRQQRLKLRDILKAVKINISGFRPISEAIITSGGISIKEVNPKTMESKIIPGLFFAGEMLDLDAYTGGFNLQIAFSTGYLAGLNIFSF